MMRTSRVFALALAASVALIACEKDEFADAPTVSAKPSEGGAAAPEAKAQAPAMKAPPLKGNTGSMPADHPPLGAAGAPSMPGAKPSGGNAGFATPADYGKTGPLRWEAPAGWTAAKPASSMRLAEYVVGGEAGPATMSIFYFGAGGGGGVEANISRWVGQFSKADGSPATDVAKRNTATVNGMNVHRVDVEGTFNPGMAGSGPPKEAQRMMGAIVESPAGLHFFKLVGPKSTMDAKAGEFDTFVASFKPGK